MAGLDCPVHPEFSKRMWSLPRFENPAYYKDSLWAQCGQPWLCIRLLLGGPANHSMPRPYSTSIAWGYQWEWTWYLKNVGGNEIKRYIYFSAKNILKSIVAVFILYYAYPCTFLWPFMCMDLIFFPKSKCMLILSFVNFLSTLIFLEANKLS